MDLLHKFAGYDFKVSSEDFMPPDQFFKGFRQTLRVQFPFNPGGSGYVRAGLGAFQLAEDL
jgi:hypothetical protein